MQGNWIELWTGAWAGAKTFWLLNGPFFFVLLVLSVLSISLILEKCLLFFRWRCRNRSLKEQASSLLKERNLSALGRLIEREAGPEADLIRKSFYFIKNELHWRPGLASRREGLLEELAGSEGELLGKHLEHRKFHDLKSQVQRLELWIYGCIEEQILNLERHLGLFHLIANISTLLGLLGTVVGMIYAFQAGALEQGSQLAQGISQALFTTAGGLLVAIPAMTCQQVCQNAIRIRAAGLEQLGREIVSYLQGQR